MMKNGIKTIIGLAAAAVLAALVKVLLKLLRRWRYRRACAIRIKDLYDSIRTISREEKE